MLGCERWTWTCCCRRLRQFFFLLFGRFVLPFSLPWLGRSKNADTKVYARGCNSTIWPKEHFSFASDAKWQRRHDQIRQIDKWKMSQWITWCAAQYHSQVNLVERNGTSQCLRVSAVCMRCILKLKMFFFQKNSRQSWSVSDSSPRVESLNFLLPMPASERRDWGNAIIPRSWPSPCHLRQRCCKPMLPTYWGSQSHDSHKTVWCRCVCVIIDRIVFLPFFPYLSTGDAGSRFIYCNIETASI